MVVFPKNRRRLRSVGLVAMLTVAIGTVSYMCWFSNDRLAVQPPGADHPPAPQNTRVTKPESPPNGYVGSSACAECHLEIFEDYSQHRMGNSLMPVTEASPLEDYERVTGFVAGKHSFRIERVEDKVFHHKILTDRDGEIIYDQSVEVHFAVGSGAVGRSYLTNRNGILFQSPITWYRHRKGNWDLSPGYRPDRDDSFERRVEDNCITCHAGRMAVITGESSRFRESPFLEKSIGCEQCHGPGKQHVESDGAIEHIVNPVKLEPRLRDEICYQCHLGGKERVLRYGRSFHDFRPGRPMDDVWTVFISGTGNKKGGKSQFISHVGQMRASVCFRSSSGRLGCISCHNAHREPTAEEKVEFYRSRCLSCHSRKSCSLPAEERLRPPASNSCFHCHMPQLTSSDIPHASETDHRIIRDPKSITGNSQRSESGETWTFFDDADKRIPHWEVKRARGLVLLTQGVYLEDRPLILQARSFLESSLETAPDDVAVLHSLSLIASLVDDFPTERRYLEKALEYQSNYEKSLVSMCLLCYRTDQIEEGLQYSKRLLAINPWHGARHGIYAEFLEASGNRSAAIKAARRGVELSPASLEVRSMLADLYRRHGDHEASRRQLRRIQQIRSLLNP